MKVTEALVAKLTEEKPLVQPDNHLTDLANGMANQLGDLATTMESEAHHGVYPLAPVKAAMLKIQNTLKILDKAVEEFSSANYTGRYGQ